MLKNIFAKIRSLWRTKVEDTTKEWEEDDIPEVTQISKYQILIDAEFSQRLRFLLTNKMPYRLTKHQFQTIIRNPLREEI